jgi:hypothetical protein
MLQDRSGMQFWKYTAESMASSFLEIHVSEPAKRSCIIEMAVSP